MACFLYSGMASIDPCIEAQVVTLVALKCSTIRLSWSQGGLESSHVVSCIWCCHSRLNISLLKVGCVGCGIISTFTLNLVCKIASSSKGVNKTVSRISAHKANYDALSLMLGQVSGGEWAAPHSVRATVHSFTSGVLVLHRGSASV